LIRIHIVLHSGVCFVFAGLSGENPNQANPVLSIV
jgi:hypothetical protein